jgi:hypothetical protein
MDEIRGLVERIKDWVEGERVKGIRKANL